MSFFQIITAAASVKNYGATSNGVTDDIVAINQALQDHPVIYFEDNTTTVIGSSMVIPSNRTIIIGNNAVIKLKSGASDYIMRNEDFTNGNSSITIVGLNQSATIFGNKIGGQTRDYSTNALDPNSYWGFGLWFVRTSHLQIKNLTIKDTEAWGVGHYDCPYSIFEDIKFDQSIGIGLNGDGVTGFSSHIIIRNISGYTNDDMVFIGAGGGTVEANEMGLIDFDIDDVLIENIVGELKEGVPTVNGVRVSGRLGHRVKNITINKVQGHFKYWGVDVANFWTGELYVDNISISNVFKYSIENDTYPTVNIDKVIIRKLDISDLYANQISGADQKPINIGTNAKISYMTVNNVHQYCEAGITIPVIFDNGDIFNIALNNIYTRNTNPVMASGVIYVKNAARTYHTRLRLSNCRVEKVSGSTQNSCITLVAGSLAVSGTSDYVSKTGLTPDAGDVIVDPTDGLISYNGTSWV